MEIFDSNLLTVTVDHSRICSNFNAISQAISQLKQQVNQMASSREETHQEMKDLKNAISHLGETSRLQTRQISNQKMLIDKLNSQLTLIGFDGEQQSAFSEVENKIQEGGQKHSKAIEQIQAENDDRKQRKTVEKGLHKGQTSDSAKGNVFERLLTGLRDRLKTLQEEVVEKGTKIDEISQFMNSKKNKTLEARRRIEARSHILNKTVINKQQSRKDLSMKTMENRFTEETSREEDGEAYSSMKKAGVDLMEVTQGLGSQQSIEDDMEGRLHALETHFTAVHDNFKEKTRILDLQLKESKVKVQNLERNFDVLERSHQMLKYEVQHSGCTTEDVSSKRRILPLISREKPMKDETSAGLATEQYQDKIVKLFEYMESIRREYLSLIDKINQEQQGQLSTQGQSQARICKALKVRDDEGLRKEIIEYRQDVINLRGEFEYLSAQMNTGQGEKRTILIKPNQTKEDWKSLSIKMHKLKLDLTGSIRQIETKIVANNEIGVSVKELEAGMEQFRVLMRRKVQNSDFQKSLKRIETRLNSFIMQYFEKDGQENENEASIGRQPWFCLTCDSELKSFNAKMPRPVPTYEKMTGKKVNPETHMVRRNENGRLPSVLK